MKNFFFKLQNFNRLILIFLDCFSFILLFFFIINFIFETFSQSLFFQVVNYITGVYITINDSYR
jgi:hypothetical protein